MVAYADMRLCRRRSRSAFRNNKTASGSQPPIAGSGSWAPHRGALTVGDGRSPLLRTLGACPTSPNSVSTITPNQPNLVAGVGWHQQKPLISAHALPHRGSGIQFSDNLSPFRSSACRLSDDQSSRHRGRPPAAASRLLQRRNVATAGGRFSGRAAVRTTPIGVLRPFRRAGHSVVEISERARGPRWTGLFAAAKIWTWTRVAESPLIARRPPSSRPRRPALPSQKSSSAPGGWPLGNRGHRGCLREGAVGQSISPSARARLTASARLCTPSFL